jgi:hypothetical protein
LSRPVEGARAVVALCHAALDQALEQYLAVLPAGVVWALDAETELQDQVLTVKLTFRPRGDA